MYDHNIICRNDSIDFCFNEDIVKPITSFEEKIAKTAKITMCFLLLIFALKYVIIRRSDISRYELDKYCEKMQVYLISNFSIRDPTPTKINKFRGRDKQRVFIF